MTVTEPPMVPWLAATVNADEVLLLQTPAPTQIVHISEVEETVPLLKIVGVSVAPGVDVSIGNQASILPQVRLPGSKAGVVAEMVVLFATTTLVAAALPNVTVAPAAKFVPVMVRDVPPAVEPLLGETLLTVGGAT